MLVPQAYDQLVVARLFEFWGRDTPWQRRLWTIGSMGAIEEVLEAATAVQASVLDEKALKALQAESRRLVGRDPGIGDSRTREALGKLLDVSSDLGAGRVSWHSLKQLLPGLREDYLVRWAVAIREAPPPGPERVARHVAAHLLEAGYSTGYLHRWLTYHVRHRPEVLAVADIIELAEADLVRRAHRNFCVIVPCTAVPFASTSAMPSGWAEPTEIAARIEKIQGERASIRQSGGFVFDLEARDPDAAVELALDLVGRWTARLELGTDRTLALASHVWVDGLRSPIPVTRNRRGVDIGALVRERLVYAPLRDDPLSQRIDDALQLLQPLETGSRATAIGGGWAALEALLVSPGEQPKAIAAERLAAIVTCSWPRAELTTLSYAHTSGNDALGAQLAAAGDNLERSRLVADAIRAGNQLVLGADGHVAAAARLDEALRTPSKVMSTIRDYVATALRRLYRQRNLTLHGGLVSGAGRTATLLTVPALVGAGLDRIVHAYFVEGLSPIELAARAELRLALLEAAGGPHLWELLEPY